MSTNEISIISNFLQDAIASAPEKERNQLAQALEDYAEKYSRTVDGIRSGRGSKWLTELMEAMIEGSDARIEMKE